MTKAPAPEMQGLRRQASPHCITGAPFDEIAARVEAAKETKPAPGLARAMVCRCPSHQDRRPSLLVSETDDGRPLLHCRAGCDFLEIVHALGLEAGDMVPEHMRHARTDGNRSPHKGPRFSPWAALQALSVDVTTVALAAAQIRRDGWLDDADLEALIQAEARIQSTIQAGGFRV